MVIWSKVFITGALEINSRLLMTDVLPYILALYGKTVKVMHGHDMQEMSAVMQHCKFRGGITILIREGKNHKSKVVRGMCMKYLHQILHSWLIQFLSSDIESIGQALVNSLIHPAQSVRVEGRKSFLNACFRNYPKFWHKIAHSPDTNVFVNYERLKNYMLANSVSLALKFLIKKTKRS